MKRRVLCVFNYIERKLAYTNPSKKRKKSILKHMNTSYKSQKNLAIIELFSCLALCFFV